MASGTSRGLYTLLAGLIVTTGLWALMMASSADRDAANAMSAGLPAAPQGWEARDVPAIAQGFGSVSANSVARTYTRNDLVVNVTISRSAQAVVAARAAGRNVTDPQMRAVIGDSAAGNMYQVIDRDGWEGWTAVPETGDATATAYRDDMLVQVTAAPTNARVLARFMDALDWAGIADYATQG